MKGSQWNFRRTINHVGIKQKKLEQHTALGYT
jgi:hypothetical protein